jgi:hypothetical protein
VAVSGDVAAQAMAMPKADPAAAADGSADEPLRLPKPFGIALDTARLLG